MKITLDIPDGTVVAFLNYVWYDENRTGYMGTHALETNDLYDGAVVVIAEKEGLRHGKTD